MPASAVCDLGIYLDADISMQTHITRSVSTCFAVLRQLRTLRRLVTRGSAVTDRRAGRNAATLWQCSSRRVIKLLASSAAVCPERCSPSDPFYTAASARLATSQESSLAQCS